ncbi:MAG: gamma-glutamylcyclotransferase [Acidobacteriota bacterium]|nr:gamma-glutamylcyclotransferase [Acidobacteriota bacterium]
MDLLFVYGTLRGDFDNECARMLRANADLVEQTAMPGSIFRVGPYPGYRRTPEGAVRGEVYRLRNAAETLRALDEYEGEEYERVAVNGIWIYQYKVQPPEIERILSGDYCRP